MKLIKLSALLVLALAVSLGTTGCKKKNHGITPIPNPHPQVGGTGPGYEQIGTTPINTGGDTVGTTGGGPQPTTWSRDTVTEDRTRFAAFTVHFAFDSATVRSSDQSKISSVAADLQANQALKLIIEGHCDERGTEGYNQALGDKRANTLREELVKLGVNPERIISVSFGEMKPVSSGHNDAAWEQNRRGEFIAGTPK